VPLLLHGNYEVRHEAKTQTGSSGWVEFSSKKPSTPHISASDAYRNELRRRTDSVRKIRRRGY